MSIAKRGFSLIELIIAFALITIGFFVFFSVFSTSAQHAVQTQNRAAANMLAQSYMDDVRSHVFGAPAPAVWSEKEDRPVRMLIKDRETQFLFHKTMKFETGAAIGANGATGNTDKMILVITWKEASGNDQTANVGATDFPGDNKMLSVEMPLWR